MTALESVYELTIFVTLFTSESLQPFSAMAFNPCEVQYPILDSIAPLIVKIESGSLIILTSDSLAYLSISLCASS